MDRPLGGGYRGGRGGFQSRSSLQQSSYPRDGAQKVPGTGVLARYANADRIQQNKPDERQNLDNDWVHDRYDDGDRNGGDSRSARSRRDDDYYDDRRDDRRDYPRRDDRKDDRRDDRRDEVRREDRRDDYRDPPRDDGRDSGRDYGRDSGRASARDSGRDLLRDRSDRSAPPPARIRVDNVHWEISEDDLWDLFGRIAKVQDVKVTYDRAGRPDGTAFVTYATIADARAAVREFDGANAKGEPIRLTILPLPPKPAPQAKSNPFDRVENPRSIFDRIEQPQSTSRSRRRSESPTDQDRGYRRSERGGRREPRGGLRDRRSDTSKPAPDGIDRYTPGTGPRGGRRPAERRERPPREERPGARPRKTAEELDAEMDDYWGQDGNNNAGQNVAKTQQNGHATLDDDIDMIS